MESSYHYYGTYIDENNLLHEVDNVIATDLHPTSDKFYTKIKEAISYYEHTYNKLIIKSFTKLS